jgi:integrase
MGVKIREKPKGSGVWWIFINHHGKRKSKRVGDKKTAREVAKKIEAKLILGELKIERAVSKCPTFQEFAEIWVTLPHDWKESTKELYQDNLKLHIYPVLGDRRLDEIKRKDLKLFADGLLIKGLAPSTTALILAPINGVLSHAVDSELIGNNPLRDMKISKKKKESEIEPLTDKEAGQLLEQSKKFVGGEYYPSLLCALRTGMRIGEMQALKWKDIDFEKRLIEVKRSCRKGRVTGTKNRKQRQVDMTPHLAETLWALRTELKRDALKNGTPFSEYVFTGKRYEMLNRSSFKYALEQCLKSAGLRRIRTHDLRHSYATIRLLRGHNVGDVSYQLGHSSIKITYDIYGHWMPGKFKSEVDELDNLHPNAPYAHPESEESKNL